MKAGLRFSRSHHIVKKFQSGDPNRRSVMTYVLNLTSLFVWLWFGSFLVTGSLRTVSPEGLSAAKSCPASLAGEWAAVQCLSLADLSHGRVLRVVEAILMILTPVVALGYVTLSLALVTCSGTGSTVKPWSLGFFWILILDMVTSVTSSGHRLGRHGTGALGLTGYEIMNEIPIL